MITAMIDPVTEVIYTSAAFRRGQAAARADARLGSSAPNTDVLDRMSEEFSSGYLHEWTHYIAPLTPSPSSVDWTL